MRKDQYKLMRFKGCFGGEGWFELYNHENDLDQPTNLFDSEKSVAAQMKDELFERLDAADREFAKR